MPTSQKPLRIEIPVTLSELKVAFSVAALAFEGDLPASSFHLQLITQNITDWKAKALDSCKSRNGIKGDTPS
jgi:hypothetical protein